MVRRPTRSTAPLFTPEVASMCVNMVQLQQCGILEIQIDTLHVVLQQTPVPHALPSMYAPSWLYCYLAIFTSVCVSVTAYCTCIIRTLLPW